MRSLVARLWRVALVGQQPIDDLTGTRPVPAAVGGERSCEFCDCRLTASGEVLKMSDKARALRTLEDRLLREQEDHARTKGELVAAAARVAELQAQLNPAAKPASKWGLS